MANQGTERLLARERFVAMRKEAVSPALMRRRVYLGGMKPHAR